ncbi:L,D-transpeptidase [Pseudonocardia spinosispora]|uniref:L,D-transpeptidase n=1 Tax=Pseudonocardia spinosispora TaxID=103441 RepID=UPI000426E6BC|nr:L,D-transpeptidase [Pseudonocardia spinosispora]
MSKKWVAPMALVIGLLAAPGVANARERPGDSAPARVEGTPCALGVRACVSLKSQQAWLISDDEVVEGPVDVATGGPGKETPVGDFVVQWKDKNHTSSEYRTPQGAPSPMPYSVFFADGGVAFHQGTLNRASAGCVRLPKSQAITFYDTLQLGDKVQVR